MDLYLSTSLAQSQWISSFSPMLLHLLDLRRLTFQFSCSSVCANNLSGNLPAGLQNFKNLRFLQANQFSGPIPDELGNLTNLTGLQFGSNQFTGSLPSSLSRLVNLEDLRVCDNNFSGIIPGFIGNWYQLEKLHLYASGLKGPIPDEVASLQNISELIISDTTGINSFAHISSNAIETLILRNVGLSGSIPSYIWNKSQLNTFYLTQNMLSGNIESGEFLNNRSNIDLSYNNFSWSSSCQEKRTRSGLLPCAGPIKCRNYTLCGICKT